MKNWEAKIPQPKKNKERKRCYTMWKRLFDRFTAGGKVVWLSDKELTFFQMKHPETEFIEVLERDKLEEYKKYIHATVD